MWRALLTSLCLFCALALPAIAQNRHALVIGINDYVQIEPLQKAVNDARAVADAFQQVGFQTDLMVDPDAEDMGLGLDRFIARLSPGDEAVFYFAGHGVELGGQTFLLPSDVSAESERVLRRQAYLVNDLMTDIRLRGVRATVMILDACRNNPFPPSSPARSIARSGGLGAVQSPPEGSFILYSAAAGEVALDALSLDDPNPNSVFTRALLPRITQPGLTLTQLSRDVRVETRRLAQTIGQDQFSAFYDQLEGDFVFTPAAAIAPNQVSRVEEPADPCAAARATWALIADLEDATVFQTFVEQYGACPLMTALANSRLTELMSPKPKPAPQLARSAIVPAGYCAIQIAVFSDRSELGNYLATLDRAYSFDVQVLNTNEGWFAVVLDIVPVSDRVWQLERLRADPFIPLDAFCSDGSSYVEILDSSNLRSTRDILRISDPQDGWLNFRTGPSTSYDIIRRLDNGLRVQVLRRSGRWAQVQTSGNERGWIFESHTQRVQ